MTKHKLGLSGLPRAELPKLRSVMRGGWVFLVPLGVLLYTLMIGNWEAGKAGMLAVGATLLVGCVQKATRPDWRGVMDAVEGTGRTMLDLIAITALAGIVIGAFQLSGLTSKLPIVLTSAAGVAGLLKNGAGEAERVACVLTGHGLKDPQTALAHAGSVVPCEPDIAAVERSIDA